MTYELIIIGLAIHGLIWEHLPHWGTWFTRFIKMLPQPLQTLYDQWRCPFCAGFWIALGLHALTGFWTLPMLELLAATMGPAGPILAWFLDALATAILIKLGTLAIFALSLPAMKAHQMKAEFLASMEKQP